ncbi:uncharacterized protein TNCV_5141171 [Trichonephila clavipes]|nr:uncharacterized protein TNCV_5141171 [Trichonephila clavipes]
MVCDDNHEGLPVAICYSNRVCSIILEPFFEEIRNRLTHLQPKVFMSDDPAFWNAWQRVFGDVKYNLLCSWHVSRSWNRNLSSKFDHGSKLSGPSPNISFALVQLCKLHSMIDLWAILSLCCTILRLKCIFRICSKYKHSKLTFLFCQKHSKEEFHSREVETSTASMRTQTSSFGD